MRERRVALVTRSAATHCPTAWSSGCRPIPRRSSTFGGLSWRGRAAIRRDEFAPRRLRVGDDATIGEIVRTKLGREVCYQFVEPMVGGIQAGRIDELSAQSVFPALLEAARQGGALTRALRQEGPVNPGPRAAMVADAPAFYTLKNGVGSLPAELAERLGERGVVLRTGVAGDRTSPNTGWVRTRGRSTRGTPPPPLTRWCWPSPRQRLDHCLARTTRRSTTYVGLRAPAPP